MERNDLINSAYKLQQVGAKAAEEYGTKTNLLANLMNRKMEGRPDLLDLVGVNNVDMMKDNHANHVRFMESIFHQHSPEILVDTVIWVFRAYRSRNFSSTYWSAQLNTWIEILKNEISPESFQEIYPYYYWMQIYIPIFNKLAEENLGAPFSAH